MILERFISWLQRPHHHIRSLPLHNCPSHLGRILLRLLTCFHFLPLILARIGLPSVRQPAFSPPLGPPDLLFQLVFTSEQVLLLSKLQPLIFKFILLLSLTDY